MPVKRVILAAGDGSRFLPVTRCVPKEMLPIVDRPALDYVVQEMIGAGIDPRSGEYFATETVNRIAQAGRVVACTVSGPRYDTGKPVGYLQTIFEVPLRHTELGPSLRACAEQALPSDQ